MSSWYRNSVGISILRRERADEVCASKAEREATRLFVALREPVYLYLARVLRDAAAAEDLTQEAFLSLYSTLHKGTRVTDPRAWVFRVAHNLAINWHRKVKTHGEEGLESRRPLTAELSDTRRTVGTPLFGIIRSAEGNRNVQLALKYSF
jgi:RNA polymerase sigma factor (sigma-70 family)